MLKNNKRSIIQRQNIAETLTERIRENLLSGVYPVNTLLRQETLAEEFGVSRMPVREALRNLEIEGLVVVKSGRGALVPELSIDEVDEIFRLRILLEVELLKAAIPKATDRELSQSEALAVELDTAYHNNDIGAWGELNARFHLSLYAPSAMKATLAIVQRLNYQIDRYVRLQLVLDQDMRKAAIEHKDLCRLCRGREIGRATALLRQHIDNTRNKLITTLAAKKTIGAVNAPRADSDGKQ